MNALPTKTVLLSFEVPPNRVDEAIQAMKKLGFDKARDSVPWRDVLKYETAELPGAALAGARYREGLTQVQLSEKIRHSSATYIRNGKWQAINRQAERTKIGRSPQY